MKVFVWREFARDYTSGMAVAIANDVEEARRLVNDDMPYSGEDLAADPEVYELTEPVAFTVAGGG